MSHWDEWVNLFLLICFGGSAIRYYGLYEQTAGICVKYDLVRSNLLNRGKFSYQQIQDGHEVQYENWGYRYGFGLKEGKTYRLLRNKKNPNKVVGYNVLVIDAVIAVTSLIGQIVFLVVR